MEFARLVRVDEFQHVGNAGPPTIRLGRACAVRKRSDLRPAIGDLVNPKKARPPLGGGDCNLRKINALE
jgi:hypothetical protein